jgi:hypothetical protein
MDAVNDASKRRDYKDLPIGSSCILAHAVSLFKAAFQSSHSKTKNRVIVAIARA